MLDGISSLIEKGLLISNELPDGDLRFRMLEVVREYAREALEANGELDATSRRHAVYFVALGVRAEPHLEAAQSAEWLNRLESEHANLRVALSWAIDNDVNLGQRLAGAIWRFWWLHGHIREACDWIEAFLSQRADADAPARTKMLLGAGFLNRLRRNFEMAGRFAQEGLALSEKTGDKRSSAFALYQLALLALDNKDMRLAGSLFEKGLDFAHDSGNMQILALLLNGLGELSRSQANYAKAAEFYRQALLINREVGDLTRQVTNLINLGATAIAQNDQKSAGEFYRAGLEIGSKMKDMNGSLYCLEGVAGAIWASCDAKRAARLLGAADALRSTNNLFLEPADRIPYEQSVSLVRTSLDKKVFADYFSKGSKMKLEDAVELALAESTIGQPKAERLAMLYF